MLKRFRADRALFLAIALVLALAVGARLAVDHWPEPVCGLVVGKWAEEDSDGGRRYFLSVLTEHGRTQHATVEIDKEAFEVTQRNSFWPHKH